MPPRGRPPKLREDRVREGGTAKQGALSHRPLPTAVNLAPRVDELNRPVRPADLPVEAIELWEDAITWLIDRNAAQIVDLPELKMMCFHYADAMKMRKVLDVQGYFAHGSTGQMTAHPAVAMWKMASAEFKRYADDFGLSTMARTRLGLLDNMRKNLESDLMDGLGRNPRRTSRALPPAPREIAPG